MQVEGFGQYTVLLTGVLFVGSGTATGEMMDLTMGSFVTHRHNGTRAIFVREGIIYVRIRTLVGQRLRFVLAIYRRRTAVDVRVLGGAESKVSVRNVQRIAHRTRGGNSVDIITFANRERQTMRIGRRTNRIFGRVANGRVINGLFAHFR